MKTKKWAILCALLLSVSGFTTLAQETINGSLPDGYVAIKEEDARQYQKNLKAYKKLIQDHLYLKDMFESLQIQYKDLIEQMSHQKPDCTQLEVERKNLSDQLDQLRKKAVENQQTINNLRNSMLFCREQVYKFRERAGRKLDRKIKLNGENSSLDMGQH